MKLKLVFKSAKEIIEKEVELDEFTLMSLLKDKVIIEIAKQIDSKTCTDYGCHLSAIIDND